MVELLTPQAARRAIRAHRGTVETVTPLPDDYAHIPITKRAAGTLIAAAEAAGAWLVVSVHGGILVISANEGYRDGN